jgi:hypothetical protein
METWSRGDMETQWRLGNVEIGDMDNIKRKTIFLNPFAHRANESLSFVRLLTKKQTEVIRLQTD